jgi:hypothetical protein
MNFPVGVEKLFHELRNCSIHGQARLRKTVKQVTLRSATGAAQGNFSRLRCNLHRHGAAAAGIAFACN